MVINSITFRVNEEEIRKLRGLPKIALLINYREYQQ
jgi:hypothetical protein